MSHERIYLQPGTGDDATWCQDRINDDDIEYVRADLYAAAQAEIERLEDALLDIKELAELGGRYSAKAGWVAEQALAGESGDGYEVKR